MISVSLDEDTTLPLILVCHMRKISLLTFLMLLALPVFAQSPAGYTYSVSFRDDPALVDEPTTLLLDVTDAGGLPVDGLEDALELDLRLDQVVQRFSLTAGDTPGRYVADVIPTDAGPWEVEVVGEIDGRSEYAAFSCVAGDFVCPTDREPLGFPVAATESAELDERLGQLEAGVASATASDPLAFFGVIAGTLGLLAGGAALMRKKV